MLNKTFYSSDGPQSSRTWIALRFSLESHNFEIVRHDRSNESVEESVLPVSEFWAAANENEIDAFVTFIDTLLSDS